LLAVALLMISAASAAFASHLVLNGAGGAMSIGADFVLTGGGVANPAGTISIECPITSVQNGTYVVTYNCSGGSFSYQSNDGKTTVAASFGTRGSSPVRIGRWKRRQDSLLLHFLGQLHWNRNSRPKFLRLKPRNQG
jgi:hypothetical protein